MRISCDYERLPKALVLLILASLASPLSPVYAQGQTTTLQLNQISTFSISSTTKSLSISLPQTQQAVVLSVELCTQIDGQQPPNFFASESTTPQRTSTASTSTTSGTNPQIALPEDGDPLDVSNGLGLWKSAGSLSNGGTLSVQTVQTTGTNSWSFSVGLSTDSKAFQFLYIIY